MRSSAQTKLQADVEDEYGVPIDWLLGVMYNTLGASTYQIGDDIGISGETVREWMDSHDIPRLDKHESRTRGKSWRQKQVEERIGLPIDEILVAEYIELGKGVDVVADEIGVSKKSILNWMSEYNINTRPVGSPKGQNHPRWSGGDSITESLRMLLGDKSWLNVRKENRDDQCYKCESDDDRLHVHHIVPLKAGGTNDAWNLMTLCTSCHTTVEHRTENIVAYNMNESE